MPPPSVTVPSSPTVGAPTKEALPPRSPWLTSAAAPLTAALLTGRPPGASGLGCPLPSPSPLRAPLSWLLAFVAYTPWGSTPEEGEEAEERQRAEAGDDAGEAAAADVGVAGDTQALGKATVRAEVDAASTGSDRGEDNADVAVGAAAEAPATAASKASAFFRSAVEQAGRVEEEEGGGGRKRAHS